MGSSSLWSEITRNPIYRRLPAGAFSWIVQRARAWRTGLIPADTQLVGLPKGRHGEVQHQPATGAVQTYISRDSPEWRQELAYIHELLHRALLPALSDGEGEHDDLHALAGLIQAWIDQEDEARTSMYDERNVVLTDNYPRRVGVRAGSGVAIAARGPDPRAQAVMAANRGWIVPILYKMWMVGSLVWPLAGIRRLKPQHNISRFRADDFETFFKQITGALDVGATKSNPDYDRNAVAGGAAANSQIAVTSIGLIVSISDTQDLDNCAPFLIEHFATAVGATQLDYLVHPDWLEAGGLVQWFCLHCNNDRGTGVPVALDDLDAQTIAGERRDGSVICVESVNYRELQG